MKKTHLLPITLLATLSSPIAMAQFSGSGELGYSNNTGNTENSALYAALKMKYEQEKYLLSL